MLDDAIDEDGRLRVRGRVVVELDGDQDDVFKQLIEQHTRRMMAATLLAAMVAPGATNVVTGESVKQVVEAADCIMEKTK